MSKKTVDRVLEAYDDGYLRVEFDNYYIACAGETIRLPRAEFLIFSRLVQTPDRVVPALDLWETAWGKRKEFNSVSLHVYIYRLRQRFAPFGLEIKTMVNVGYRLIPRQNSVPAIK